MARVHLIYKNPRYKVVQKDNKYLLIDLEQHWYSYLFPMLNWIIPIKYIELTYEEFSSLNIYTNRNHSAYGVAAGGIGVIISIYIRKIMYLIDIYLSTTYMFLIFSLGLIFIILIRIYISKRLKIKKFKKKEKKKIILFPTLKNLMIVLIGFLLFLFLSLMPYYVIFGNDFNIIFYVGWLVMVLMFTVLNMCTITDRKIHVKIIN
ncbi:DUF443 domain-containing protein [Staphylococcus pettenkoferi]|uniref:DUF443 family protein n=1 Tax=Staphylococcus pettenkoferi TaxID=170573 RepID=UPI0022751520|nr:DUF443 family protein [Staphylococcus pettenkoferi]MCY1569409.1 DUF443 domain-containing protein [Staphylococcus pettenkoferi]MCY1575759.1 DUF443 domain-containing protein [Staphylococcus pettenkoferi]MCY1617340.1 DUF443 domain-containing protein [Staphylococcus pettenkoferi]